MVAVVNSPLFANNFPLNTTETYASKRARGVAADVTVGAVAGTTATRNVARVQNDPITSNSGKRLIANDAEINRATTAQDVTNLKNAVKGEKIASSLVFPRDLSGNGGGAFTRS